MKYGRKVTTSIILVRSSVLSLEGGAALLIWNHKEKKKLTALTRYSSTSGVFFGSRK